MTDTTNTDLLDNMAQALDDSAELVDAMPGNEVGRMMLVGRGDLTVPPQAAIAMMRFQAAALRQLATDRKAGRSRVRKTGHSTDG